MAGRETNLHDPQVQTHQKKAPFAWKSWVKTARPFSLTATVSPILVGTAVAAYDGTFHLVNFLVTLCSSLFLQIGTNYFNEYFDYRYGLDTPASLGSITVIFRREMTAAQVLAGGVGSFVIAAALGLLLIYLVSPAIILFGLVGIAIAYFYSARPFKFATRGLGDILVYIAMGFLMTWGAYYVQLPRWSWFAFAASVPVGLLVTADRKAFAVGIKRTATLHLQFGVMLALGIVVAMISKSFGI